MSEPHVYTRYVAKKARYGGQDKYFGPFESWSELKAFADAHDLSVAVIELIDPTKSSPEDWWG